jgi:uncharacterized lipoprotein YbaY
LGREARRVEPESLDAGDHHAYRRQVVSPDTATIGVTLQLELEDKASNPVQVMAQAAVRNRSFMF